MFLGFQNVAINILAYEPDHWCKVKRLENFTIGQEVSTISQMSQLKLLGIGTMYSFINFKLFLICEELKVVLISNAVQISTEM